MKPKYGEKAKLCYIGYQKLYSVQRNRIHLQRHCKIMKLKDHYPSERKTNK